MTQCKCGCFTIVCVYAFVSLCMCVWGGYNLSAFLHCVDVFLFVFTSVCVCARVGMCVCLQVCVPVAGFRETGN